MSQSTTPQASSPFWKWAKRIGCTMVLLAVMSCCVLCGGGWWMLDSLRAMNKDEVDRIHVEGLHRGDLAKIHARADQAFRKRYSVEDLQAFLQDRPGLFDRENFFGMEFVRRKIDGVEYVKIKSKRGWFTLDQWEIVFKVVDGEYRLVGISPGMDELVPPGFRQGAGGGRHDWWD